MGLSDVSLRSGKESVDSGFDLKVDFSFYVFDVFEICRNCHALESEFVLFPSGLVCDFQELLNRFFGFEFGNFHEFI